LSALHLSAAFYAYTSTGDMSLQRSTIYSTPTSDPIGSSPPSAPSATEDQTDFMDSAESEAFALATSSENRSCLR
jgi:hypothetical protein